MRCRMGQLGVGGKVGGWWSHREGRGIDLARRRRSCSRWSSPLRTGGGGPHANTSGGASWKSSSRAARSTHPRQSTRAGAIGSNEVGCSEAGQRAGDGFDPVASVQFMDTEVGLVEIAKREVALRERHGVAPEGFEALCAAIRAETKINKNLARIVKFP